MNTPTMTSNPPLKKYWVVIVNANKSQCYEIDATSPVDAVEMAWLESKIPTCFWENTQVYVFDSAPLHIVQKSVFDRNGMPGF